SDLKLLNSNIGRLAMPIALISDLDCWVLIVILIPFCANPRNAPYVITTTTAYLLASFYTIGPFLAWVVRRTSDGNENNYSDFYLCFVLVGVIVSAFSTDVTGTHSVVGAFVFGLIMPDELALVLERFDYFVSGLMMPLFFAVSGIRVDILKITEWSLVLFIVIMLCAVTIISFLPIFLSLTLTLKIQGLCGDDCYNSINDQYSCSHNCRHLQADQSSIDYNSRSRTIQQAKAEAELRIIACIHSFCNVPGILKLLDVSHGSQHNHTTVFTPHLVELTGRGSAMLIVHDSHKHRFDDPVYHPAYGDRSETDKIVNAFREYENKTCNVSIQSFAAVSPFVAMHGDISHLAEGKQVAFLILPFHKQATKEGNLLERSSAFRNMNQNVLLNVPCSVGIFIDRGLQEATGAKSSNGINQIAMVFLGGADDWEALAYPRRMARKPGVSLKVIRLLEMNSMDLANSKNSMQSSSSYLDRQRQIDDDYINEFRIRTVGEELIMYEEKSLFNGEELVVELKEIENKFELFIVGRRDGLASPLTTELSNWVDCPELGIIGDLLAISDSATGSVLVVQQCIDSGHSHVIEDLVGTPISSRDGTVMDFGSRRLSMSSSTRLGMYTRQKRRMIMMTMMMINGVILFFSPFF
ncbi:cation/H(+) antiporter 15-like, partial [Durio zibethinus]|uniref:Cation/H(+) antiporter 15-like n=1 Tax=Durio zibethinus TaxID=66656 RepID=A0A6P5X6G2_DURZI